MWLLHSVDIQGQFAPRQVVLEELESPGGWVKTECWAHWATESVGLYGAQEWWWWMCVWAGEGWLNKFPGDSNVSESHQASL